MTMKSLKAAGKLTPAMIEVINDLTHRIALDASQIDSRLFERTYRETSPDQIYLRALTGECPNVKDEAYGFSIVGNRDGKWLKVTLAYSDKYADDVSTHRRLTALKRTLAVTRDEYRPPLHWTDFLYQNPDYYPYLQKLLEFSANTIQALAAEHPQHNTY